MSLKTFRLFKNFKEKRLLCKKLYLNLRKILTSYFVRSVMLYEAETWSEGKVGYSKHRCGVKWLMADSKIV